MYFISGGGHSYENNFQVGVDTLIDGYPSTHPAYTGSYEPVMDAFRWAGYAPEFFPTGPMSKLRLDEVHHSVLQKIKDDAARNPAEPFAVGGTSVGGDIALDLAATLQDDPELGNRLIGVIALSPSPYYKPFVTDMLESEIYKGKLDFLNFPPDEQQRLQTRHEFPRNLRVPVMLFAGQEDMIYIQRFIGAARMAWQETSDDISIEGAKHQLFNRLYQRAVANYAGRLMLAGTHPKDIGELIKSKAETTDMTSLKWRTPSNAKTQFAFGPGGWVVIRNTEMPDDPELFINPMTWVCMLRGNAGTNHQNCAIRGAFAPLLRGIDYADLQT